MNAPLQSPEGRLRWPQFSIGELMGASATIAITLVWPGALLLVCCSVLVVLMNRAGITFLGMLIIISLLGFALGLGLPLLYWNR